MRLLCPWDFPVMSTGVGCHFLLLWILGLSLTKGWGAGIDKWKKLFLLSSPHHLRMRNGQSTTQQCRVIRDPEWICIVFHKVELITLKEENETKVSYTIFSTPPITAFSRNGEWARRLVIYISYFFLEILRLFAWTGDLKIVISLPSFLPWTLWILNTSTRLDFSQSL